MTCDTCGWVFNKFCDACMKRLEQESELESQKLFCYNKSRKENNGHKARKERKRKT